MTVLTDRNVLDVKPSVQHDREEAARKVGVSFDKKAREVQGARVVKDPHSLNALADVLMPSLPEWERRNIEKWHQAKSHREFKFLKSLLPK